MIYQPRAQLCELFFLFLQLGKVSDEAGQNTFSVKLPSKRGGSIFVTANLYPAIVKTLEEWQNVAHQDPSLMWETWRRVDYPVRTISGFNPRRFATALEALLVGLEDVAPYVKLGDAS